MDAQLDIAANRSATNYSVAEWVRRAAWAAGSVVFTLTPGPLHGLRSALLRAFGARIGRHVRVSRTARILFPWNLEIGDWSSVGDHARIYSLGRVAIGSRATVSQYAHLCAGTHDPRDPAMRLLKPPIRIGDEAWICADAFVGPGVTVGEGAVCGARAVVVRDVAPWTIVAGNPARPVKKRELSMQR